MSCKPKSQPQLMLDESIGKLPPTKHHELCMLLNIDNSWKRLAEILPNRSGTGERFSAEDVMTFAMQRDPTEALLSSWRNDYITFSTLIHWLSVAGLIREACLVRKAADDSFVDTPGCKPCNCDKCCVYEVPARLLHETQPVYQTLNTVQPPPNNDDTLATESNELSPVECPTSRENIPDSPADHVSYYLLSVWTNNFDKKQAENGGNLLGEGGYAAVFRGFDPATNKLFAVKRVKPQDDSDDSKHSPKNQLANELRILSKLEHDNIVKLVGYSTDGPFHCIIYEYISSGSLEDRLACRNYAVPLRAPQRISILGGIARGLAYLHSERYIHMDVKSANILLDDCSSPKISDYGITRPGPVNPDDTSIRTGVIIGTTVYIAPEILRGGRISVKADSYSFGVVMLEVLTGLPAFDSNREDPDLPTHVFQTCGDEMEMLDERADDWDDVDSQRVYRMAQRLLGHYKTRPEITKILDEVTSWTFETLPKTVFTDPPVLSVVGS